VTVVASAIAGGAIRYSVTNELVGERDGEKIY